MNIDNEYPELPANRNGIDTYALYCLKHELAYWLKYNTFYRDGMLRMRNGAIDVKPPKISIGMDTVNRGAKIIIALVVEPFCDEETSHYVQQFIDERANLQTRIPLLLFDTSATIFDNQGNALDKNWVREALELIVLQVESKRYEHYLIEDQWTTRLYVYLDEDPYYTDVIQPLLQTINEQLVEMWHAGLVKGVGKLLSSWPLKDLGNGWYRPYEVLQRFMQPIPLFYRNLAKGNNTVSARVGYNYVIMMDIVKQLGNRVIFKADRVLMQVNNYQELKQLDEAIIHAIDQTGKVIMTSTKHQHKVTYEYVTANIDGKDRLLIALPIHEISLLYLQQLRKEPVKKVVDKRLLRG